MKHSIRSTIYALFIILLMGLSTPLRAQFEAPEFDKISGAKEIARFKKRFRNINWTGRGFNKKSAIDNIQTNKLRAKLQAVFGAPTLKIEDLIGKPNFRPGKAIQFEYHFVINNKIPLMLLDIDGPFGHGLVYVGAAKYIDLMPQIKRTLARKLMKAEPSAYQDYFYSPERAQWFDVRYENEKFTIKKISSPQGVAAGY